jgi:hypothetical protein
MKHLAAITLVVVLAGCASATSNYQPPSTSARNYSKEVNRPKDLVWNDTVAALGQRFFVINNMDKASGLINLSYSGDP